VGQKCCFGIAFPGTFILDRQGRVTSRYFEDFYIERNTVSSIMLRLGGKAAPVAGTKISSGQLDITTYPSESAIAPGNRFSIALDVTPHPGIHVYAPGAKNYRVIALNIDAQGFRVDVVCMFLDPLPRVFRLGQNLWSIGRKCLSLSPIVCTVANPRHSPLGSACIDSARSRTHAERLRARAGSCGATSETSIDRHLSSTTRRFVWTCELGGRQ
jgi:hypothetical protein